MKRETSSEYFNKKTAAWEESNGHEKASASASVNGKSDINGVVKHHATEVARNAEEEDQKAAGVVQLVIAVAGIYASL